MSLLKGDFKDRLKVSDETMGLVVGGIPEEMRRGLFRDKAPAPQSVRVELLRAKEGVDVRFQAELDNADAAKEFTKFVFKMRQEGLDGLKKMQAAELPLPPSAIAAMRRTLESIQIQPKGAGVEGALFVPTEALLTGPLWFLGRGGEDRPPPRKDKELRRAPLLPAPLPG